MKKRGPYLSDKYYLARVSGLLHLCIAYSTWLSLLNGLHFSNRIQLHEDYNLSNLELMCMHCLQLGMSFVLKSVRTKIRNLRWTIIVLFLTQIEATIFESQNEASSLASNNTMSPNSSRMSVPISIDDETKCIV